MPDNKYQRYLASREWALLKNAVRGRSGGTCERCHLADHQDTHHLTYERLYNERIEDLLGVCRPCHEYLSGKSDFDPASEAVLMPVVQISYRHDGFQDWTATFTRLDQPTDPGFDFKVIDPSTDLAIVVAAMREPLAVWHPMVISGSVKAAMDWEFSKDREDGEGRPLYAQRISTLFFRCFAPDPCELCKPTGPY